MKINIIILNYNGKELMKRCLPSIVDAAKKSKHNCRVSVIDNLSQDDSVSFLKNNFLDMDIIVAGENKVLCSYNDIIKQIDDDVVILLNNDIKVDENFVDPLVETINEDNENFLVTPKCLTFNEKVYEGSKTKARIIWGLFWASSKFKGYERGIDMQGCTFSAGFGAFDRKKFLELEGYDNLYLPGTLEDSDICFRAWKRGWKCLYQPKSIIYHMGQVSFHRRFGRRQTKIVNFRNLFLFMWKNITDRRILFKHFIFLPPRLLYSILTGKPELFIGFLKAVPKLKKALLRRNSVDMDSKRTDKEIFDMFKV